jgi:hypothetical protein
MKQPTLAEVAQVLHWVLRRCEAQAPQNFYPAGAAVIGRHIEAWTHAHRPSQTLTKADAIAYEKALMLSTYPQKGPTV